jgi:hypothetical protein
MNRFGWNLETMNNYCKENNIEYTVLDIKWIEKAYQKQLWTLVKCPDKNHEAYWVWWNNFTKGYRCKLCYYKDNDFITWTEDKVIQFYKNYGLKVVNIYDWKNVDFPIEAEDEIGFKYFISITNLKSYGKSSFICNTYNPFTLYNIKLYCRLHRPDYELINNEYKGIKELYVWKYLGNMLPDTENREFELTADSFINAGSGHPYFSKSNGVIMFEALLNFNKIKYKREKTFNGCKDKILLRFDFYLPDTNEVIEIGVEKMHIMIE